MSDTDLDKKFKRGSFKLPSSFKQQEEQQQTLPPTPQPNTSNGPQPPPSRKITLGNRNSQTNLVNNGNTQTSTTDNKSPDTKDSTIKNEMDEFDLDPVPISRPRTNRAATMIPSNLLKDDKRRPLKIGTERTNNPDNNNNNEETDSISKPTSTPPKIPPKRKSMALNQVQIQQQQQTNTSTDDDDDDDDEAISTFSTNSWSNILNKKQDFNFTNRNKGTGTGTISTDQNGNGENQTSEEPSSRRGTFRKPIIIGTHINQEEEDKFIEETSQKLSSLDLANVSRPKQQYHTIDPSSIPQWKKNNEEFSDIQDQKPTNTTTTNSGKFTFSSILKNSPLSKSGQSPTSSSTNVSKGLTKGEVEYNEYLQKAKGGQFPDIEKLNFIYHAGKDNLGRTLIVIIASHLPVKETDMERVLLYTISIMDPVVEGDYVLVYCHTNMNNANKPSFSWLKKVYTIFNRKYKKNLKGLYIVHPTSWIKFILGLFKPFLSKKFWRKLVYIDDLTDLFKFFSKDQLNLPSHVMMHRPSGKKLAPIFGAPLEEVVQRPDNPNEIPVLFEKGLSYLERRALQVEGLFRLSGANSQIKSLRAGFDAGEDVDLEDVDDVHTVAGLLKLYLRELPQPLFPFDTYSSFIEIIRGDVPKPQKIESVKLLISLLPPANKALTKHLFKFLEKVVKNAHINKMTSVNLSIVFAPNLLKDGENNILTQVSDTQYVNQVVQLIVDNVSIIIPQ